MVEPTPIRSRRQKPPAPVKPIDPDELELLQECSKHTTEDGRPLLYFEQGQKPADVLREAVEVVVTENNARLQAGGFHKDLIFRTGKDTGQFVTLAKDDEGAVRVKLLTTTNISMALQSRFCYLSTGKKASHQPNPGWFAGALNYGDTEYRFPILNGLLNHPAIHLDGTIVTREGYDPVTKCWIVAGWDNLKVPEKPTAAQVTAAVETLREPFEEVIFRGDDVVKAAPVKSKGVEMTASEANALGLLLTALVRRQMATAPFFIITSSQWGTAKGLIASVAAQIAQDTGPLLTDMKISADQQEKNVDRVLHDHPGALIIQFDEPQDSTSNGRFHSRKLALLATTDQYINRPVYGHRAVSVDTRRTMIFTGISIRPDQDMVRRVSLIELDIPHDGTLPHERTFKHADRSDKVLLLQWVSANRRRFIEAAITLFSHWRAGGCPQADFSFDYPEWIHVVGGVLQHAKVTAWMGNRDEVYANADEALKTSFVLKLIEAVGVGPITSREIALKLKSMKEPEAVKDTLVWNEPWATKLYQTWGDVDAMTYNIGRLLGGMKDRLLSNGDGGRATVSNYGSDGGIKWTFTTLDKAAVKPKRGGQKRS